MARLQGGSLAQLPSGCWSVRWRDHEGRQKRKTFRKNQEGEAQAFLARQIDETERLRRGEVVERPREVPSFDALADEYLASHPCSANTRRTLKERLVRARRQFGSKAVNRITVAELRAWRAQLPAGSAHDLVRTVKQVLSYAHACELIPRNPAKDVPNPQPVRAEIATFTREEIDAIDAELPRHLRGLVIFASEAALRPEELVALRHGDIDRKAGVVHVRRVYTRADGMREGQAKTQKSIRTVPLTRRALEALPIPNLDPNALLWPGQRSGEPLSWHWFRAKVWKPAFTAAGLEYRVPYALRHTALSEWLSRGVPVLDVAKFGGTSMLMIQRTYGHLTADSHDRFREALEAAR